MGAVVSGEGKRRLRVNTSSTRFIQHDGRIIPPRNARPNPTSPIKKESHENTTKGTTRGIIKTSQNVHVNHSGPHSSMFNKRFKRSGGLTVRPDRVVRSSGFGLHGGVHYSSVVPRVVTGTALCDVGGTSEV